MSGFQTDACNYEFLAIKDDPSNDVIPHRCEAAVKARPEHLSGARKSNGNLLFSRLPVA
jgi:hypothetical protein